MIHASVTFCIAEAGRIENDNFIHIGKSVAVGLEDVRDEFEYLTLESTCIVAAGFRECLINLMQSI